MIVCLQMVWMVGLFIKTLKHFSERSSSAARLLTCLPEVLPSFFGIWANSKLPLLVLWTKGPLSRWKILESTITIDGLYLKATRPSINDLPNESARTTIESQYLKLLKIQSEFQSLNQLASSNRHEQTHPGFYRGHGNWSNGYSRSLADMSPTGNHGKERVVQLVESMFPPPKKKTRFIYFLLVINRYWLESSANFLTSNPTALWNLIILDIGS